MRAATRVGCLTLSLVVLAAATVGGCSSDGRASGATGATCSAPEAGAGDSGATSASGPTRCVSTSAAACPDVFALVAASTTYQSGGLGAIATDVCASSFASGLELGGDAALASSSGHPFWVDREGDHVYPLDACGGPHGRIDLSQGADPQDVAVDSSCNLWIPDFLVPRLEHRAADGTVLQTVDLSSYDDDGNPDASSASLATTSRGEELFVTLENLDANHAPEAFSHMLVVDVATATATDVVKLAGQNPFGLTTVAGAHLYLAEPGSFSAIAEPAAGVERFDPETRSGTLVATETALGGSVVEVAVTRRRGVRRGHRRRAVGASIAPRWCGFDARRGAGEQR